MTITESVLYDHAVDGDQNEVVLSATGAKRIELFFRDITYASSDRIGLWSSEDGGSTKETSADEYEGILITNSGGSAGFTFPSVVLDNATTGTHRGYVEVLGLASAIVRTAFLSLASDGGTTHDRYNVRKTAAVENALIIGTVGGALIKSGQIVARVET